MVRKVRGCRKITGKMMFVGAFFLACGLIGNPASANLTGPCSNCHTMHASQNGSINTEVHVDNGTFASWSGGVLTGGNSPLPQQDLLKTNCVGCHSNTGPETIVLLGTNKIPIVYNTGGYPTGASTQVTALAGGNFAGVSGNHTYGHNVGGISPSDINLSGAPAPGDPGGCAQTSCHGDLTTTSTEFFGYSGTYKNTALYADKINGCVGCHNKVAHHAETDPSYRYLGGHGNPIDFVYGGTSPNLYEDDDWEQTNGSADHNFYEAQNSLTGPFTSVGRFCAGCHPLFHSVGEAPFDSWTGEMNGGDFNDNSEGAGGRIVVNSPGQNPWMRHPTNVNIPIGDATGEYNQLNGLPYSPLVPVAQIPDATGWANRNSIQFGDQVMCLSCHRAHASDQPDALRFPYDGMIAHGAAAQDLNTGCFFCHRTKDE